MQAVLPRPDIAPLLEQHFVLVAGDADLPEPEVHKLVFKLRNASMLPFVIVADADGKFLEGSAGASDPARIKALIERTLPGAKRDEPVKG